MSGRPWTPGPWSTHPEDLRGGRYWVIDMPGMAADDYFDEPFAIHESDNGEANARLIAAAPDLYEAVNEMLDHEPSREDFRSDAKGDLQFKIATQVWERARAALAKADGRGE